MADMESSDNVGSQNGNLKSKTLITRSGDERPNNVAESEKSVELPTFKVPELLHPDQLKQPRQNETFETASASETENKVEEDKEKITSKFDNLSPAEKLKESQIPIPYKEPSWGGLSKDKFSFEVLKNGVIIDTIDLTKSFYIIGRLPSCDITLEHPSLSRHHAVIQYCTTKTDKHNIGWYLYDLDSTHGTWINKNKVYAKKYYGIHVGHVLKFGGSTRLFILQGPDEDIEEESEMSITEIKEQREKQKKGAEILRRADLAAQEKKMEEIRKKEDDSSCSWGMADDAIDEENTNPFSDEIKLENEDLYITDPKKALKGFYEREGYEEPEYIVTDVGSGKYKCAVELPVDGPNGEPVIAEAIVSGKKKEAVLQCALEGCRILDRMNLLRASTHESRKRKQKNWEDDDFYDSDEDLYLDRTGDIEKKRKRRMKKAGKMEGKTETYQSLLEKHEIIIKEIQDIETKLEKAKSDAAAVDSGDLDALDAYMMAIKSGVMDTKTKMALKRQLMELKQEEAKTRMYINIAKPASLPELKSPSITSKPSLPQKQNQLPIVGKIKSNKAQKRPLVISNSVKKKNEAEEEFVEEEDEEDAPPEKYVKEDPTRRLQEKQLEDPTRRLQEKQIGDSSSRSQQTKSSNSQELVENDQNSTSSQISRESKTRLKDTVSLTDNPKVKLKIESDSSTKKKLQHELPHKKDKQTTQPKTEGKITGDYNSTDPDYAVWMPPSGQTGDGKTSLNEKFGY